MLKKNITYIISNTNKALAFEWVSTYLNKDKINLNFILLNPGNSELEIYLKQNKIPVNRIKYTNKKDIPFAIFQVYKILKKKRIHIIHTHLFDANIIGLSAGILARIPKRIYTRHHSTYHHDYFPKAIKYDRICNYFATDIVAISKNVLTVLHQKENVSLSKIHLIHHGFKLTSFTNVSNDKIKSLRIKYNIEGSPLQYPIIGVISRYTKWKGIQFIIPAFKKILEKYPNAMLILANADGNYKKEIHQLIQKIPEKNYKEIVFEADLFALYKLFDFFVHVPINSHAEAFGQVYVEALAAGVPSVFTISGISSEFIINKENAIVVDYKSIEDIYNGLILLINNKSLAEHISNQGKKSVSNLFELNNMIKKLEDLYLNE